MVTPWGTTLTIGQVKLRLQDNGLVAIEKVGHPESRRALQAPEMESLTEFIERLVQPCRRMSFRVVMNQLPASEAHLRVGLRVRGRRLQAVPMDLSLTGVRLCVFESCERGERVELSIRDGRHSVKLTGMIVRIRPNEVAIQFDHELGKEPAALARIHRRLELAWLRSRSRIGTAHRT